jgi:hypothetical protein
VFKQKALRGYFAASPIPRFVLCQFLLGFGMKAD